MTALRGELPHTEPTGEGLVVKDTTMACSLTSFVYHQVLAPRVVGFRTGQNDGIMIDIRYIRFNNSASGHFAVDSVRTVRIWFD